MSTRFTQPVQGAPPERRNRLSVLWDLLTQAGLAEIVLRLGTHVLLLALILLVAWGLRSLYLNTAEMDKAGGRSSGGAAGLSIAVGLPTATPTARPIPLPAVNQVDRLGGQDLANTTNQKGIARRVRLHTDVPSRGRDEVQVYTIKAGDTFLGVAEKFGIQLDTLLWANQYVLGDNPHNLRLGQEINILPVDGAYHRWSAGDGLSNVADFYHVDMNAIISFPGNHLNPDSLGDPANPNIAPGSWLIIPGGQRDFVSWSAPVIPLDKPEVAKVLGPGACESVTAGAPGTGAFLWPANDHYLSGFDYLPGANHAAIDIAGEKDSPVFAADHGVVVYAGWNNWGYGNVVVINHGNGWQTLYGHLSAYYVTCGMSVRQGSTIGGMGDIGDPSGVHLHFEMMYNGVKVNPHDYIR